MSVKLLTEHNLKFLYLKGVAKARRSLHMSKCDIVGNDMSRLFYTIRVSNSLDLNQDRCSVF